MSSKAKKNKKNQNNAKNPESFQNELLQYISQNEEIAKSEYECDAEINKLKQENEQHLQKVKQYSPQDLFNEIISTIKDCIALEKDEEASFAKLNEINQETVKYVQMAKSWDKNYGEIVEYNQSLLDKVKMGTEEKAKLIELENKNTEQVKEQAQKFKDDVLEKYNSSTNDKIIKDNDMLKERLKECKEQIEKVRASLHEQEEMRAKGTDLESLFQSHFSEFNKQGTESQNKIDELKLQVDNAQKRYKELTQTVKNKTKKFEGQKKQYEKVMRDYMTFQKENNELKILDPESMKLEIEKNNVTLDILVKENKALQSKIQELKKLKEKINANSQP
jgi:hypothetical protein